MVWWWLSYICWFEAIVGMLWLLSHVHVSRQKEIWQRLPSSAQLKLFSDSSRTCLWQTDWTLSTVTLQWNSLLMTAVWVIGPSILSRHLKKQVESLIFLSDKSFHTALNGKIGLFDLNFSVPSKLVCMAAPAQSRRQTEMCGKKISWMDSTWSGVHLHVHLFSVWNWSSEI